MRMANKRILVSGASGFIGRHTLPFLIRDGWEVHATHHGIPVTGTTGIVWHPCDLLDRDQACSLVASIGASHWLHLAWYAEPGKYWTSPENFRWVTATMNMLEAFRAAGGVRVVAAGTCAEYDWNYGYCREAVTPLAPSTLYGKCKHTLHQLMAAYGDAYDLQVAWGRVFYLYGPHEYQERLIPFVVRSLLVGRPALCTHGNQIRDYLYVEDAASAFIALINSHVVGPVNIASGKPVVLREMLRAVGSEIGREDLIQYGAIAPPANEPSTLFADVSRLEKEVGWLQKKDLVSGLKETVAFWKTHG